MPIIEPVKGLLSGLEKTLDVLCEKNVETIVIMNPQIGHHRDDGAEINGLINIKYQASNNIILGFYLSETTEIGEVCHFLDSHISRKVALVHAGFSKAKELKEVISTRYEITKHIFLEKNCGKLYQKHFDVQGNNNAVLIRDGFQQKRGRDYPDLELFSDLHVTYELERVQGFGDFLTVGDNYSETGGPAYTIVIHITFIDEVNDSVMFIHHFKSIRQNTPTDPAGKFAEALNLLVGCVNSPQNKIDDTGAIREFKSLYERRHFPGLGYVKKLSMRHHIETMARFLSAQRVD